MSNKHKHYDKIVAKSENKNLVQFIKMDGEWENAGLSDKFISFSEEYDYFLCLPQHNENGQCLHWLNGGEVECNSNLTSGWETCHDISNITWCDSIGLMREDAKYRIKPKKEKRWIGVDPSHQQQSTKLFKSEDDLFSYFGGCAGNASGYQFIEIEVEV